MKIEKKAYIVFAITFLHVLLLLNSDVQPKSIKDKVEAGKLYDFAEDNECWCQLTDCAVKDDCLYVLYGDKGILKTYDLDGVYKKSFAFQKSKGESSLRADEVFVYLYDQKLNCYVFSAGECVDYIKYDDYKAYLAKTDTFVSAEGQKETNGYRFYVKWASIYKEIPNGTTVQVVHRPVFFVYFQGMAPFVVIMFWMAVFTSMIITKERDY